MSNITITFQGEAREVRQAMRELLEGASSPSSPFSASEETPLPWAGGRTQILVQRAYQWRSANSRRDRSPTKRISDAGASIEIEYVADINGCSKQFGWPSIAEVPGETTPNRSRCLGGVPDG